jgi:hypothetical protein
MHDGLRFDGARAVDITVMLKGKDGAGPKLKDFKAYVDANEVPEIKALKHEVEQFAKEFPTIGFEKVRLACHAPQRCAVLPRRASRGRRAAGGWTTLSQAPRDLGSTTCFAA